MLSPTIFSMMNNRLNEICDVSSENNVFFGDKCILLLGDLFQLRPVANKYIFQQEDNLVNLWNLFEPVIFTSNLRQASDPLFARLLTSLRGGKLNDEIDAHLRSRCILKSVNKNKYREMKKLYDEEYKYLPHLYSLRKEAEEHNFRIVSELSKTTKDPVLEIKAIDSKNECFSVRKRMKCVKADEVTVKKQKDVDEQAGLYDKVWIVKGCRVMLTHNLDTKVGLVNGALGTVVGIHWLNKKSGKVDGDLEANSVGLSLVKWKNEWPCLTTNMPHYVEILFDGNEKTTKIEPITLLFRDACGSNMMRKQFCLTIAYGLTIHKSQGATIKKGVVQLNFKFTPDSGLYVAITRFPSLQSFILLDYTRKSFRCNMAAVNEIARLEVIFKENMKMGKVEKPKSFFLANSSMNVIIVVNNVEKFPDIPFDSATINAENLKSTKRNSVNYVEEVRNYGSSIDSNVFSVVFQLWREVNFCANVAGLLSVFELSNCLNHNEFLVQEKLKYDAGLSMLQPLFDGINHFVVTFSDEPNVVKVYDSLMRDELTDLLKIQIWQIFGRSGDTLKILLMDVEPQKLDGNSCGIFSVVYSFMLSFGKNPCDMEFDEVVIRGWLADLLSDKKIVEPPMRVRRCLSAPRVILELGESVAIAELQLRRSSGRLPVNFHDDADIQLIEMCGSVD